LSSERIKKLEAEAKIMAQEHARLVAQVEIAKLEDRIEQLKKTISSLDIEIEKNRRAL